MLSYSGILSSTRTIIDDNRIDIRTICESIVRESRETVNTLSDISVSSSSSLREEGGSGEVWGREWHWQHWRCSFPDGISSLQSPVTNSWRVGPHWGGVLERSQCNPWNEHFLSDGKRAGTHRPRSTLSSSVFSSPVSRISPNACNSVYSEMQRHA